jgi:hypothetical protein
MAPTLAAAGRRGEIEPRRGTKPMGEAECPCSGHSARTFRTRRRMKALKSTFTWKGATLRSGTDPRTAGGPTIDRSSDRAIASCGPTDGGHRGDPMAPAHGSPSEGPPRGEREPARDALRSHGACLRVCHGDRFISGGTPAWTSQETTGRTGTTRRRARAPRRAVAEPSRLRRGARSTGVSRAPCPDRPFTARAVDDPCLAPSS